MNIERPIHPHFQLYLDLKGKELIDLYMDLRQFVLSLCPDSNELLYNTHALVSAYSLSDRVAETFCMIPIYTNHMNLGFSKGTLLQDPKKLLKGTGKLMRHIPISTVNDYRNKYVEALINNAIQFVMDDMDLKRKQENLTISKIKIPNQ